MQTRLRCHQVRMRRGQLGGQQPAAAGVRPPLRRCFDAPSYVVRRLNCTCPCVTHPHHRPGSYTQRQQPRQQRPCIAVASSSLLSAPAPPHRRSSAHAQHRYQQPPLSLQPPPPPPLRTRPPPQQQHCQQRSPRRRCRLQAGPACTMLRDA